MFGVMSITLDWQSLGIALIFVFGIGLPATLVFAYFYGVKMDKVGWPIERSDLSTMLTILSKWKQQL